MIEIHQYRGFRGVSVDDICSGKSSVAQIVEAIQKICPDKKRGRRRIEERVFVINGKLVRCIAAKIN